MHHSVYREFHISLAPDTERYETAPNVFQSESVMYVMLRHKDTGQDTVFKLRGNDGQADLWIEEQVMRRFPDSAAAAELRHLYGKTRHTLKQGWDKAFGDRIYHGLRFFCDSKGAVLWTALIASLPSLLYTTMCARAVARLHELPETAPLQAIIYTVHDAWLDVLREAQSISRPIPQQQRLALELHHWNSDLLDAMSLLEFSHLKDKAHFARLALGYLADSDWIAALSPILVDAPSSTLPADAPPATRTAS